jgi:hemolysin III
VYKGEKFNAITHLLGAALALAGSAVLVWRAADARRSASFAIYGATLVLAYLASTLYHSFRGRPKRLFQRLDHASIYLLIAGTYTPFALVTLPPAWGFPLLGAVIALGATGIGLALLPARRSRRMLQVALTLLMGWLAILALAPLAHALAPRGLLWLAAGGALYTSGVVPYSWRALPRNHELWHLFVLGGSACHYAAMFYV